MKKYVLFLLVLGAFFINIQLVNADCEDAMKEVEKIKVFKKNVIPTYDELNGEMSGGDDFLMGLRIEGLTDKVYAEISNDYDFNVVTVKYEDTDNGSYEITSPYIYKSVKFTVRLLSNDSSCPSTSALKTAQIDTDVFNEFYYTRQCSENTDLEICQPTTDNSKHSDNINSFLEAFQKEKEEKDKTVFDKTFDFVKKYYLFILIPLLLFSAIFIVRIVMVKRGMKNE